MSSTHEIPVTLDSPDGNIHVVPVYDVIEHIESVQCECRPALSYRDLGTGKEVWAHNLLKESPQ